jgi:hypothetical protein
MRKLIYLNFCLLFLFPALAFAQWEDAQISRLTTDIYENRLYSIMEIDKNDKIYLIYLQDPKPYTTNVTDLLITREKGSNWSVPLVIGNPAYKNTLKYHHRFGIDLRNGVIHCLYAYGDTLFYTNNTLNWEVAKIDSNANYSGGDRLFCDSLGNVHFSWKSEYYVSGIRYYHVMYMTNASGQWIKQQVSPEIYIGIVGSFFAPQMVVEKGGRAHIIYYTSDFIYHIVNDTLGGTNWTEDSLSYPFCCWNEVQDFKIGKNNSLHMLLRGSDVQYPYLDPDFTTYYYYRDSISTQWNPPEVITSIGIWGWLFVDSLTEPHVIWGIVSLANYYYANKKKGYWESTQILDNTYYPENPLFVLDSGGKGYAAFVGFSYVWTDSSEIYYFGPSPGFVSPDNPERPLNFQLKQNYPNPFNPNTTIPFTVYGSQFIVHSPIHTTLKIYNILGQLVRTLLDEEKISGDYQVIWDGKDQDGKEVKSGIYFYVLSCDKFKDSRKMLLIR